MVKQNLSVPLAPLVDSRVLTPIRGLAFYRHGVLILSCGFLGIFGGFQAAQGLQTSLNATLGFINLASLYTTFTLLCLVAPMVLGLLESTLGFRIVLLLSGLAYVAMIFANIDIQGWVLPISMSILVGIAAPFLWTCQNDFVGRCAYHASRAENLSLAALTAELNGLFFSIYQFAGMAGTALASVLMLAFAGNPWMKEVLFFVLGGVSLVGAASFLCLPRIGPASDTPERASIRDTGALVFGDTRMSLLVPLIFTNGMTLSFAVGDYPACVVCPVLGPNFTGFVAATFYGVNTVATAVWGRLISRGVISRRTAYIVSTLSVIAFLALIFLWRVPDNFQKQGVDWQQVSKPRTMDMLRVFWLVALFAIGDAFWEPGPVATLQNYFLGTKSIVPAMANYKMWQSLGYAAQFIIGAEMGSSPAARVAILAGLAAASLLCVLLLDRRSSLQ